MGKCISTAEKLGKELRDSYERWNHILQNGAGDPFWKDGANMNLVRNHIIHYKRQCEAELLPEEYPEEYFWELPTEVDNKYMALPEEIRKHAIGSLAAYEANEDYQYLKEAVNKLTEKQKSQISIMNVINYVTGLKSFIKKFSGGNEEARASGAVSGIVPGLPEKGGRYSEPGTGGKAASYRPAVFVRFVRIDNGRITAIA